MPDSENVLYEASDLIRGEKRKEYGPVYESFSRIAQLWEAYLGLPRLTSRQVAHMMILMKISRDTIPKRDNLVDIAGYVGCIELMEKDAEELLPPQPPQGSEPLTSFQEWSRQQQIKRRDAMLKAMDPNERT